MGFLAEMLAVAVVWLSSFALCQFGVVIDHAVRPHAKSSEARTVNRSRDVSQPPPITANGPPAASAGA